jgi:hypothetical protein
VTVQILLFLRHSILQCSSSKAQSRVLGIYLMEKTFSFLLLNNRFSKANAQWTRAARARLRHSLLVIF